MRRAFVLLAAVPLLALLPMALAVAHEKLADGQPVPAWIKQSCCGPNDYHLLKPEEVHARPDGWHVDGYKAVIPYGEELPSPDGTYVGFWLDYGDGQQSPMYCFFVPVQGF